MKHAELKLIHGHGAGQVFPLDREETVIGRLNCDITLEDSKISRRHARIIRRGDTFEVEDLGSRNGLTVNKSRMPRAYLGEDDTIKIGDYIFRFHFKQPEKLIVTGLQSGTYRDVTLDVRSTETMVVDLEKAGGESLEALRRTREALAALYKAGQTISSTLNTGELYEKALDIIMEVIKPTDCCSIHVVNEEGFLQCACTRYRDVSHTGDDHKFSTSIIDCVLKEQKAVLTFDAMTDDRFQGSQSIASMSIRSAMCVPLQAPGHMIGVIQASTVVPANRFSKEDLKLIAAIGMQLGAAIENAVLYEKLTQERDALEDANTRLKQAQMSLIQSEKLAAVGELAAGIIHDIKNPMAVIHGHTQLLQSVFDKSEIKEIDNLNIPESLGEIDNGVNHCGKIINQLLQFAKGSDPSKEPTKLNELIDDTLKFLSHEFCKNKVETKFEEGELNEIMLDENQIKQALINILLNAIQAMDGGGSITIRTWQGIEDGENYGFISIADTGKGMTESEQTSIFDPFFSTKRMSDAAGTGGTGLGLSVTYGIIKNHQGEIMVESAIGQGTTFIIKLPEKSSPVEAEPTPAPV